MFNTQDYDSNGIQGRHYNRFGKSTLIYDETVTCISIDVFKDLILWFRGHLYIKCKTCSGTLHKISFKIAGFVTIYIIGVSSCISLS